MKDKMVNRQVYRQEDILRERIDMALHIISTKRGYTRNGKKAVADLRPSLIVDKER